MHNATDRIEVLIRQVVGGSEVDQMGVFIRTGTDKINGRSVKIAAISSLLLKGIRIFCSSAATHRQQWTFNTEVKGFKPF
jgi:hypothetical protein